jgi:hypothetical protein
MNGYEENYTPLRDLSEGDEFIDKSNSVGIYLKPLGGDRHLLKSMNLGVEYEVPHGRFPIFKKIINSKQK